MFNDRRFIVPLTKINEVRQRFENRAAATKASGGDPTPWKFCIRALTDLAAETRSTGLRAWNGPTPADRAACRIIAVTALENETRAENCRRAAEGQLGSHRQTVLGEAIESDAKARHLWHALMALMEHTGIGADDLDVVIPEPLNTGHG